MQKTLLKPDVVLVVLLAVGLVVGGYFVFINLRRPSTPVTQVSSSVNPNLNEQTTEAIQKCLKTDNLGGRALCLDQTFRTYLETQTSKQALALLHELSQKDVGIRAVAHPIAHAIGRETYRKAGTIDKAFNECDGTEHSGCYHGAVERAIIPDTVAGADGGISHPSYANLAERVPVLCESSQKVGVNIWFQCLHGLGHAVLFSLDYDVNKGLSICDMLKTDFEAQSCGGGLFMENIAAFDPSVRDLDRKEIQRPCNVVDLKYQSNCMMMQTSWWRELRFNSQETMEACAASPAPNACYTSWGRDLSDDVRVGHGAESAAKCELLTNTDRHACMQGTIYALADNTWDGSYAFPYCDKYQESGDRSSCYSDVIIYLKTQRDATNALIARDCDAYSANKPECVSVNERTYALEHPVSHH